MKLKIICLIISLTSLLPCIAQNRYNFVCDTYNEKGVCTYTNINGKITVTTDADGAYCILVEVRNPNGKGSWPFGFWTSPDDPPTLTYMSEHPYDDSLKKVYYMTEADEEYMIATRYENGQPSKIVMSSKWKDKLTYINIPYSVSAGNGIYGVMNTAKRKIRFK